MYIDWARPRNRAMPSCVPPSCISSLLLSQLLHVVFKINNAWRKWAIHNIIYYQDGHSMERGPSRRAFSAPGGAWRRAVSSLSHAPVHFL